MRTPRSAGRRWVLAGAAICAGISLVCSLSVIRFDPNIYDEGLIALGAAQVLEGRWPLVDFYAPYPPAAFFALALFYKLFGVSLLVERALSVTLVAISIALAFLLAVPSDREGSRHTLRQLLVAAVPVAVAGLLLGSVWVTPQMGGALVFILLAGNVLKRALGTGSIRGAALTGVTLGMAALWRSDLAFYAAVASWLVWLLREPNHRVSGAVAMTVGAAATALPVLLVFIALGGTRAFNSVFVWPLVSTYHATLPWPDLVPPLAPADLHARGILEALASWLANWNAYFPLVGLAAAVWQFVCPAPQSGSERSVALWLALTGLGFGIYASGRSDFTHMIPLLLASLTAVAASSVNALADGLRLLRWVGLTVLMVGVIALVPTPLENLKVKRSAAGRVPVPFARCSGILADAKEVESYSRLVEKIIEATTLDEPIFSGSSRHDIFMLSDNLLYFVSERAPGTYFWCLDSAVTTTAPVQAQMIDDLKSSRVRVAVRWRSFEVPDAQKATDGSHQLDEWLGASFVSVDEVGGYTIQVKRSP